MNEEEIELGKTYRCHPIGFTEDVEGEVVSKMTNTAVLRIETCNPTDQLQLEEKAKMVVARYSSFIS